MGIFERVMHERLPTSEAVTLTPIQAFAAVILGAFNADRRIVPEETSRVREIFSSTRLFRSQSAEPVQDVLDRVFDLFEEFGPGPIVTLATKALPDRLRTPVFAIAVDLVLADGQASGEERKFIDSLQSLLQIPDESAIKIVDVMLVKNSA
jgi:uncharacterized tellurite resistance protein B-like protein